MVSEIENISLWYYFELTEIIFYKFVINFEEKCVNDIFPLIFNPLKLFFWINAVSDLPH